MRTFAQKPTSISAGSFLGGNKSWIPEGLHYPTLNGFENLSMSPTRLDDIGDGHGKTVVRRI
jgi:hypothetical protein